MIRNAAVVFVNTAGPTLLILAALWTTAAYHVHLGNDLIAADTRAMAVYTDVRLLEHLSKRLDEHFRRHYE